MTGHIVAAWAEGASGPGWANRPVWVLIRDADGTLRVDAVQPPQQTTEMHALYGVSQAAHSAMTEAARRYFGPGRRA